MAEESKPLQFESKKREESSELELSLCWVVMAMSGVENSYGWHAALVLFCCMNEVGRNGVTAMDGVVRYECSRNHVVEHLVGVGAWGVL